MNLYTWFQPVILIFEQKGRGYRCNSLINQAKIALHKISGVKIGHNKTKKAQSFFALNSSGVPPTPPFARISIVWLSFGAGDLSLRQQ